MLAQRQGDLAQASVYAEEALAIAHAVGNRWGVISTHRLLGDIARDHRDTDRAMAHYRESLSRFQRHDSERDLANTLSGMGAVAVAAGQLERAARLLGAAEKLYRRVEIICPPPQRPDWADLVASIESDLGADAFARTWEAACPEKVSQEALTLCHPDARPPGRQQRRPSAASRTVRRIHGAPSPRRRLTTND
jgi:hypothetical protein